MSLRIRVTAILWTALSLCLLLFAGSAAAAEETAASVADPLVAPHDGFVDEETCTSCHAEQAAAFAKSHHAKAMALADDKSVRADFNNARFERGGVAAEFFRRDGRFFIRTEGVDGRQADFEVKYTFAYEPLQQYLVDIGHGRLQAFDVAWDTHRQEWFWLGEGSKARPGSTYHWTGPFYRWNRTCIDCHSTDPQVNFEPDTNGYKSSYVATSIGCQSCHGGGAKHVEWTEAKSRGSPMATMPGLGLATVNQDTCFACHSRRTKLLHGYKPGSTYLDHFSPALMRPDLYFPDGQILDEVFEYGSFQQSKMSRAGVVCGDCHRPHEGSLRVEGNALCTQCHAEAGPDRFKAFDPRGAFDIITHTRHPAGSAGAQCVNCHMPERTYMKVDRRRDHSFVIPRPDLSEAYGIPNACTSCHEGETNAWAAKRMDEWYGTAWRKRRTVAHAFAAAAKNEPNSIEALRAFLEDRELPAYVRASAVAEMARVGGAAAAADVKAAAEDHAPIVRLGAAEAAASLPPDLRMTAIDTLLKDKTRAVRVAAVAALGEAQSELLGEARRAFGAAADDLKAYADANADVAEAQARYGLFLASRGDMDEAERTLLRAVALDPTLVGSRINLAEFYRFAGQNGKSEHAYSSAVEAMPDSAELRYGHALALVRLKTIPDAVTELEAAVTLEPGNTRYRTTLAIALDSIGRTEEAFSLLAHAIDRQVRDADLFGAAIQFGLKLGRYEQTLSYAEELARLQPDNPAIADLLIALRSQAGHGK
ncbi:multiheme c-type cytochrome [Sinorhizobium garamanticum]|uniref:tetratricopeptide repeat protein n=1 Tax=Sinorhizobium garamanticum TaxID=680247 RepID=UPI003CC8C432